MGRAPLVTPEPCFDYWPEVPEGQARPRQLYHMSQLDPEEIDALRTAGWEPIDVRLLPEDKPELAVKAWLQGVRLGSIKPQQGQQRFVELEARIYRLYQGEAAKLDKPEVTITPNDLDAMLDSVAKKRG